MAHHTPHTEHPDTQSSPALIKTVLATTNSRQGRSLWPATAGVWATRARPHLTHGHDWSKRHEV